ncbi:hypothetical protein DL96DRAFT_8402 [Flagelloscypha sp. PMI_526]|nr:hypothetical protein DL96DRAFT_8402 [Flagelloscypha sp. PMI_526]
MSAESSKAPPSPVLDEKKLLEKGITSFDSDGESTSSTDYLPSYPTLLNTSVIFELSPLATNATCLNSAYSLPSGQVMYRVETESERWFPKKTVFKRIKGGIGGADEFETIATEHHAKWGGNTLEFDMDKEKSWKIKDSDLFTKADAFAKKSWAAFGRDRIVTLPDGRKARWWMGTWTVGLVLNDNSGTHLADFHRGHSGIRKNHPKTPRKLEIYDTAFQGVGEKSEYTQGVYIETQRKMIEFILITMVCVENVRKFRERCARY